MKGDDRNRGEGEKEQEVSGRAQKSQLVQSASELNCYLGFSSQHSY